MHVSRDFTAIFLSGKHTHLRSRHIYKYSCVSDNIFRMFRVRTGSVSVATIALEPHYARVTQSLTSTTLDSVYAILGLSFLLGKDEHFLKYWNMGTQSYPIKPTLIPLSRTGLNALVSVFELVEPCYQHCFAGR